MGGGARLLVQLTTGLVAAAILYGCGVNCEAEKEKFGRNMLASLQVSTACCVGNCPGPDGTLPDPEKPAEIDVACMCKNTNWAPWAVQAKKLRDNCALDSNQELANNVFVVLFDAYKIQCSTQAEQTTSVQVTGMALTMALASQGGKLQKTSADVLLDADQTEKELITQV